MMYGNDLVPVDRGPHPVRTRTTVVVLIGLAASGWISLVVLVGVLLVGGTDNAQQPPAPKRQAASAPARPPPQLPRAHPVVEPKRIPILSSFEDRRRVQRWMWQADVADHENGNVAAARQFYKRAVDGGWAPAALALAFTYDPHELQRRGVLIPPDARKARGCYTKATKLMKAAVDYYLQRLAPGEIGTC